MRVATEYPVTNLTTMWKEPSDKNLHIAKEPYFKVYAFMTINKENKLLCYESYLHEMRFDTMNC